MLCSIGRRAVTAGYGLETLNVELERGAIKTDECMKPTSPAFMPAATSNGKIMLAHTAYREGEVAVNNMLGKKDRMRYNAIPSVIYTNPEVGSVGETEESAKAKGYDVECVKLPHDVLRTLCRRERGERRNNQGYCGQKYRRILGVHMIANYAAEIIYGAAMMIETEITVDNLKEIVFPIPPSARSSEKRCLKLNNNKELFLICLSQCMLNPKTNSQNVPLPSKTSPFANTTRPSRTRKRISPRKIFSGMYADMVAIREFETMLQSIKLQGEYNGKKFTYPAPPTLQSVRKQPQ